MSESTRGIVYRVLAIVFVALVVFGVVTAEELNQYVEKAIAVSAALGFLLASRNTKGIGGK